MSAPTQTLDAFLPYVLPYAPGCPPLLALPALRHAAIDLCMRGRIWRHVFSYALVSNTQPAAIPANSALHEIESAWLDGRKLEPATAEAVDEYLVGSTPGDIAKYFCLADTDVVSVFPAQTGTLKLSVLLKPKQGFAYSAVTAFEDANNVVPAFMLTHHADDIAAGALMRLLLTPAQSFTNPEMAAIFAAKFNARCDELSVASAKGQQAAPLRTKSSYI